MNKTDINELLRKYEPNSNAREEYEEEDEFAWNQAVMLNR